MGLSNWRPAWFCLKASKMSNTFRWILFKKNNSSYNWLVVTACFFEYWCCERRNLKFLPRRDRTELDVINSKMKDLTERFVIHVFIVNTLKPDINLLFKTFLKSPLNVTDWCILSYPKLLFLVKTCAVIDCTCCADASSVSISRKFLFSQHQRVLIKRSSGFLP